ncbi:two component transcriptional regulator, LytTR family [Filimonas lacunae]|uniref:Two component transcriptional regulator, LytTR family n=1 Tax=Filimonas lacunae TaxID=477680 RepID=A0A173MDF7_9BACT|nr:LytTR family DNA-binding domain-containing protein [Filimonas lacunae]BAV05536.1 two-component system response regulator [Filimonas lacunae]SIT20503.1 two component transcriptional regulator, LytTR family [Filimonas lacunae]
MKIIIIEDEKLTAKDLADTILQCQPNASILTILPSVREAIAYLNKDINADLIFSDIQLGDGLSFEIFAQVSLNIPVVFCTAFDAYALEAFKANGIDYILKPFTTESVAEALQKYHALKEKLSAPAVNYADLKQLLGSKKDLDTTAILIYHKDQIFPVNLRDIAYFYLKSSTVYVNTFDGRQMTTTKSMDELSRLAEPLFFRANRQFLVNRKAIQNASNYLSRKLSVTLTVDTPETITVSKEKMSGFLEWLTTDY